MGMIIRNAINIDNESMYFQILDNLSVGVYATDTKRRIFFWNKAAEEISGYKASEIIGKSCFTSNLDHMDSQGRELCHLSCPLFATICDHSVRQAHVLLKHKSGVRIPIIVNTYPIVNKDGVIVGGYEVFYEDDTPNRCIITDSTLLNKEFYDDLTKLPNKNYLLNFLNYKFIEFEKFNRPFALLFGNLDNFTEFNAKYGIDNGDKILQNIATNINTKHRKADIIGRWQDDIFAGVFNMVDEEKADIVANKFYEWINNSDILIDDNKIGLTISVGITIVKKGDTINSIIERTCNLVKEAKKTKNRIVKDF